jgi:hypothetical protein
LRPRACADDGRSKASRGATALRTVRHQSRYPVSDLQLIRRLAGIGSKCAAARPVGPSREAISRSPWAERRAHAIYFEQRSETHGGARRLRSFGAPRHDPLQTHRCVDEYAAVIGHKSEALEIGDRVATFTRDPWGSSGFCYDLGATTQSHTWRRGSENSMITAKQYAPLALITGGSEGVAASLASNLMGAGIDLVLVARTSAENAGTGFFSRLHGIRIV